MPWFKNRMVDDGEIALEKLTVVPVIPTFTEGVETGNTISIVIQLQDPDGNDIAEAVDLLCVVRNASAQIADPGAFTMTETGTGERVSNDTQPSMIVTTSASGTCTIAVTDVSGSYAYDAYLEVTPLNRFGSVGVATLEFA